MLMTARAERGPQWDIGTQQLVAPFVSFFSCIHHLW